MGSMKSFYVFDITLAVFIILVNVDITVIGYLKKIKALGYLKFLVPLSTSFMYI